MNIEPAKASFSGSADAIINALPLPVVVVAPDGRIADANAAAESFFEISAPLLQRYLLRDIVPFGDRRQITPSMSSACARIRPPSCFTSVGSFASACATRF